MILAIDMIVKICYNIKKYLERIFNLPYGIFRRSDR